MLLKQNIPTRRLGHFRLYAGRIQVERIGGSVLEACRLLKTPKRPRLLEIRRTMSNTLASKHISDCRTLQNPVEHEQVGARTNLPGGSESRSPNQICVGRRT